MNLRFCFSFSVLFILVTAVTKVYAQPGKMTAGNGTIDELYKKFSEAYMLKDAELVGSLYEEKANYLSPDPGNPILKTRDEIKGEFSAFFNWAERNNRDLKISFHFIKRIKGTKLAFDTGYFLIQTKVSGDSTFKKAGSVGKFVTIMRKQKDSSWKFAVDGYSNAPLSAITDYRTIDSIGE